MKNEQARGRKGQLTRDDWIEAARKVLVASAVEDVKVDRLAGKLKVTRGSFYWRFRNRKDLLDALLDRWRSQNEAEIAAVRVRVGSESDKLLEVVRLWLSEAPAYPAFDMAIRVWARKSATVATLVRQVDDDWIALLQSIFRRDGEDPLESLARARLARAAARRRRAPQAGCWPRPQQRLRAIRECSPR